MPGVIDYICWRIEKNKNAILIVNGPTGSGKSYYGLSISKRISEQLGTEFSVKGNVAFSFRDLLIKTKLPQNQKPGACFLLDEIGAIGGGGMSREWQSKANKLFFSWTQTIRHKNQVLIMTCPYFTYLDSSTRKLVHMQLIMDKINYVQETSRAKPYILQISQRKEKTYFKYLRIIKGRRKYKLLYQSTPLPPKQMLAEYEALKETFTTQLEQSIIDADKPKKDKRVKVNKPLMENLINQGLSTKEIGGMMGVTRWTVNSYKKQLKQNG